MNIQIQSLTESQIQQVHEMTLQLLEGHGITMNGETVQETFKKHGAKVEGNRVHIPSKMVEDAIKSAPSEFLVTARDPKKSHVIGIGREPALVPTGGVPIVLDKNGDQDTATFDDFRNMLKLTHTSSILNFACSGSLYPTVPDQSDGILMMIYHTLLHTDKPLVGNCEGAAISNACIDMVERATGLGEDEHMVVAITNSISPMGWDGKMLDGIRTFAERNQPINITCCSMAGATAPIYLMGGIIQSNAEVLAGIVYSQLIRPGVPVIYGTTSSVVDMGSMSLTIGTPEAIEAAVDKFKDGVAEQVDSKLIEDWFSQLNWSQKDIDDEVQGMIEHYRHSGYTTEISANWDNITKIYDSVIERIKKEFPRKDDLTMLGGHSSHSYINGTNMYFVYSYDIKCEPEDELLIYHHPIQQIIVEETLRYGGSMCHHHGIGKYRSQWTKEEHGSAYYILEKLKDTFDPNGIMNYGNIFPKEDGIKAYITKEQ